MKFKVEIDLSGAQQFKSPLTALAHANAPYSRAISFEGKNLVVAKSVCEALEVLGIEFAYWGQVLTDNQPLSQPILVTIPVP